MTYMPQEGVDYLTDYYALAGVPREIEEGALHRTLNQQIAQYHPDRLQGMADELQERGTRMTQLLNRAKAILLDSGRRREYDALLTAWDGPISNDGTPIITQEGYERATLARMEPGEVEDEVVRFVGQAKMLTGHSPTTLAFLEDLVIKAGENVPDALRAQYEDALLRYDRLLAIEDDRRSKILGRPDVARHGYIAGREYARMVAGEIDDTRQRQHEELRKRALANVSGRLALLAGEAAPAQPAPDAGVSVMGEVTLPAYFDPQAEKLHEVAQKRQEIARKRLTNFEPTYPEAEMQQEAQPNLVVGVEREGTTTWFSVGFESGTGAVDLANVPGAILELLQNGELASVIRQGYNILTLSPLEQLEVKDLISESIRKASLKYGGNTAV